MSEGGENEIVTVRLLHINLVNPWRKTEYSRQRCGHESSRRKTTGRPLPSLTAPLSLLGSLQW